jgi:hypothetical protein
MAQIYAMFIHDRLLRMVEMVGPDLFPILLLSDWLPFPQPSFLKFYVHLLLPSLVTSALKMETACFSETLSSTYKTRPCQIPRQRQYYTDTCENLISQVTICFSQRILFYGLCYNIEQLHMYLMPIVLV